MRCGGSRRTSPSCRSYWAKLDARAFSSTSWVSASRSQNLARVSHAHLSSRSLQVFALRRHSLTSMRLLLLLSDIGQLVYPRRAYRIVSPSWHSSSTRLPVTSVTAPRREPLYRSIRLVIETEAQCCLAESAWRATACG